MDERLAPILERLDLLEQEERTLARQGVWQAQTPQVFKREILVEAYARRGQLGKEITDDAQLVEAFLVKKDIPKGFPGDRALDEGYIGKESIPRKFFPAKGITNAQALRGEVALAPMAAGVPVVEGNFVEPRFPMPVCASFVGSRSLSSIIAACIAMSAHGGIGVIGMPGPTSASPII